MPFVACSAFNAVLVTAISFSPVELTAISPVVAVRSELPTLIPLPVALIAVPANVLPVMLTDGFAASSVPLRVKLPPVVTVLSVMLTSLLARFRLSAVSMVTLLRPMVSVACTLTVCACTALFAPAAGPIVTVFVPAFAGSSEGA